MGILSDIVNESKKNCGCGKDPCETYGNKVVEEGTQGCADCEWISDETDGDITTCDDCAAEKREKTNEAEKRWKQTSMCPEEAIEKYGKENVKVKKGALRNGDDMVEVFVESQQMMTEAQFDEAAGEKDACYRKVKSRYKVWPSAYASGALVKCRKVGASNWGNSKK